MGTHRPIVSRIERGVHTLSLDVLQCYARALELDVVTVLAPVETEKLAGVP